MWKVKMSQHGRGMGLALGLLLVAVSGVPQDPRVTRKRLSKHSFTYLSISLALPLLPKVVMTFPENHGKQCPSFLK